MITVGVPLLIILISIFLSHKSLLSFLDDAVAFTSLGLVIRAFQGVGHATYTTAVFAIVAQTFPTAVGVAMGVLEMCVGIGLSLGPAIGAVLYEVGSVFGRSGRIGYDKQKSLSLSRLAGMDFLSTHWALFYY